MDEYFSRPCCASLINALTANSVARWDSSKPTEDGSSSDCWCCCSIMQRDVWFSSENPSEKDSVALPVEASASTCRSSWWSSSPRVPNSTTADSMSSPKQLSSTTSSPENSTSAANDALDCSGSSACEHIFVSEISLCKDAGAGRHWISSHADARSCLPI